MDFNPQDANSTGAAPTTLPEGVYALKVSDAEEQTSAKGNKMIVVFMEASDAAGRVVKLRDYLVSTPKAVFKIEQFCKAAGLNHQFQSGRLLPDDCKGRTVRARVILETGRDGYPDRNAVDEYLAHDAGIETRFEEPSASTQQDAPVRQVEDNDIPF